MPQKQSSKAQQQLQKAKAQAKKQQKRRKKELKQKQQRQKKLAQQKALIDQQVQSIYQSGLADAYKYFLQEAYREEVRFNIFQYAAQKILKFEKTRKEKEKKISNLSLGPII